MRALFTALAATLFCLLNATMSLAADTVYWSNAGDSKISFAKLDGTGGGDLATGAAAVANPQGVALDLAAGKIYWANNGNDTISFANLDGTGGGDLPTGGATVSAPTGLAIDPEAGRIYWANLTDDRISFARLNGTGGDDLETGAATVRGPSGVAIDPVAGRIYWSNLRAHKLSFANLDGSGAGDLATGAATVTFPLGVAVDPAGGRIYWANAGQTADASKISFANLDGSGGGDLATGAATVAFPEGVALDPQAGRIYWANTGAPNKISFANLDGSGGGDLATGAATVSLPSFPALLRAPSGVADPAITGDSVVGSTLACSRGDWAPGLLGASLYRAPSGFAFQWLLEGDPIQGATQETVSPTAPGSYRCRVTATNHAGSATQTSAPHTVSAVPTPSVDPSAPPSASPSNAFSFGELKLNKRNGAAKLAVIVPGPGDVELAQTKRLMPAQVQAPAEGTVTLVLRPSGRTAKKLNATGEAMVKAEVTFTPVGGTASTQSKTLNLKKR